MCLQPSKATKYAEGLKGNTSVHRRTENRKRPRGVRRKQNKLSLFEETKAVCSRETKYVTKPEETNECRGENKMQLPKRKKKVIVEPKNRSHSYCKPV